MPAASVLPRRVGRDLAGHDRKRIVSDDKELYEHIQSFVDRFVDRVVGDIREFAAEEDARKAAEFFARVGLPIHLGQLSMSNQHKDDIDIVTDAAMGASIMHNMPMVVTPELIRESILSAHELGEVVAKDIGDEAYRRLQSD